MPVCFFFFFQAEDGIRDHCVTGVQTCALPIFVSSSGIHVLERGGGDLPTPDDHPISRPHRGVRSEERRVGKECRSRGSRYHLKKEPAEERISRSSRVESSTDYGHW